MATSKKTKKSKKARVVYMVFDCAVARYDGRVFASRAAARKWIGCGVDYYTIHEVEVIE